MVLIKPKWTRWDYRYYLAYLKLPTWRLHLSHPDSWLGLTVLKTGLLRKSNDIDLEVVSLKTMSIPSIQNFYPLISILPNIKISIVSTIALGEMVKWLDISNMTTLLCTGYWVHFSSHRETSTRPWVPKTTYPRPLSPLALMVTTLPIACTHLVPALFVLLFSSIYDFGSCF